MLFDVNLACTRVGLGAIFCYCAFVYAIFYFSAVDTLVYLEPVERTVAALCATVLTSSLVMRLLLQTSRSMYAPRCGFRGPRKVKGRMTGVTRLAHVTSLASSVRESATGASYEFSIWCFESVVDTRRVRVCVNSLER